MIDAFPRFHQQQVLVIGDVMLDSFYYGRAERVSPEAPVPVVNIDKIEALPGGAANVAMNIAALGAKCHIIGLTGEDEAAQTLQQRLTAMDICCHFARSTDKATIVKQRIIGNQQQLLRIDFEQPYTVSDAEQLTDIPLPWINDIDVIVLSDYQKGTLATPQHWIALAKQYQIPVLIDPKGQDFSRYRGADLITPNFAEFQAVVGTVTSERDLKEKALAILQRWDIAAILITRSEKGMSYIAQHGDIIHLPAIAKAVSDVTGAGDTVMATVAAAIAAKASHHQAIMLANIAASIVVSQLGTATVSQPELEAEYQRQQGQKLTDHSLGGILSNEQLLLAVEQSKKNGEKIVLTNGWFDILHAGHVHYLAQAKAQGDRLIVAINRDKSVTKLKGVGRPINNEARRLAVLAGLSSVDWVTCFDGDTPEALISMLKPDLLVKGGDYDKKSVVGWQQVEAYGGEVRVMGLIDNCSTTAIVDKITQQS